MIEITFDMEDDPRVVYDSRNVVWREDGVAVLLEEGDEGWARLQPGEPGYVPPPPPKPRPARRTLRLPRQTNPHNPNNTMLPYQFITRTGTQNQVTTARVTRGTKTTAEVYAEVTARLGAQPPAVPLVIKTFLEVILDWETEGWTIEPIEDLLGFFMPSGGSFPDTDFQPNVDNMNHSAGCNFGDTGRARVAGNISYENQGHQGRIKPEIIRISDNWTGQKDHYTAAKSVCMELGNKKGKLEFSRAAGCKAEFRKADGTLVEATDYSTAGSLKISAQVPAGTTGPITEVILTMLVNGALRSGSYTTVLLE